MTDLEPQEPPAQRDRGPIWMRGLIMLIFLVLFSIGQWLLGLVALIQFLWLLFGNERNRQLADFGAGLAAWLAEVARFETCASDERPFPWARWPG